MSQTKVNFVFFGTPDVASETLEILKDAGFLPTLIVTSPDTKSGRKMLLTPPPVKTWAIENSIPYTQPENLKELVGNFSSDKAVVAREVEKNFQQAKLFIVVAYGKIIPKEILDIPQLGSLNIHYSLLPKYRGASPVESVILNGDKETGVSIQKMIFKLDAGDIVAQEKTTIMPDETAPELRKRLIKQGGELLVKTLPDFIGGKINPTPQNESEATHCRKIKKEDGLIDLDGNAAKNYNKFRAYAAWPRTFFFKDGKRIIITKARLEPARNASGIADAGGNGKFVIEKIIPEGGKETEYRINTSK